jgi:hypothetical protein
MSAGKLIAYIGAGILIFFGVLFIWAAFGSVPRPEWFVIGVISVGIGLALIWLGGRSKPAPAGGNNTTVKIDLSGDVNLETLKCRSCGGTLKPENIKLVAGAPVVSCPYCNTSYQLTEEPKW